jgi:hypothetical protein
MTSTPSDGPVFLVGSMRSGSTMLRLILDSHPAVAIGPETGFMNAVDATRHIPRFKAGDGWYRQLGWSDEEFDGRLREFYEDIFGRYAVQQGKRRWGEKTPFHTSRVHDMARIFPDARFVGIVRHPGAVARSLERRFHYTFGDAVTYWAATNLDLVRGAATLGDRLLVCRYEDLVREPEPVLKEVLDFLDEPWSPLVLRHHEVQREKGTERVTNGSTVTRDPIDADRAERWAENLAEDESRELKRAAELAALFGYRPLEARVTDAMPVAAPDRHTATGDRFPRDSSSLGARLGVAGPARFDYTEASAEELAERLVHVEAALRRTRSRRAVRVADAARRIQHGRSAADLRSLLSSLRRTQVTER